MALTCRSLCPGIGAPAVSTEPMQKFLSPHGTAYRLSSRSQSLHAQWLITINNNFTNITVSRSRTAPFAYLNSLVKVASCLTEFFILFWIFYFILLFLKVVSCSLACFVSRLVLLRKKKKNLFFHHSPDPFVLVGSIVWALETVG